MGLTHKAQLHEGWLRDTAVAAGTAGAIMAGAGAYNKAKNARAEHFRELPRESKELLRDDYLSLPKNPSLGQFVEHRRRDLGSTKWLGWKPGYLLPGAPAKKDAWIEHISSYQLSGSDYNRAVQDYYEKFGNGSIAESVARAMLMEDDSDDAAGLVDAPVPPVDDASLDVGAMNEFNVGDDVNMSAPPNTGPGAPDVGGDEERIPDTEIYMPEESTPPKRVGTIIGFEEEVKDYSGIIKLMREGKSIEEALNVSHEEEKEDAKAKKIRVRWSDGTETLENPSVLAIAESVPFVQQNPTEIPLESKDEVLKTFLRMLGRISDKLPNQNLSEIENRIVPGIFSWLFSPKTKYAKGAVAVPEVIDYTSYTAGCWLNSIDFMTNYGEDYTNYKLAHGVCFSEDQLKALIDKLDKDLVPVNFHFVKHGFIEVDGDKIFDATLKDNTNYYYFYRTIPEEIWNSLRYTIKKEQGEWNVEDFANYTAAQILDSRIERVIPLQEAYVRFTSLLESTKSEDEIEADINHILGWYFAKDEDTRSETATFNMLRKYLQDNNLSEEEYKWAFDLLDRNWSDKYKNYDALWDSVMEKKRAN